MWSCGLVLTLSVSLPFGLSPPWIFMCDICEMHYCQTASLFQCSLLKCLRNVITNHTWRASWHSHKVRMKYENDYGDLRLYYHDFLIIASLIYFCLLSPPFPPSLSFFPLNVLPLADAEVEQKGKSEERKKKHAHHHNHVLNVWLPVTF